ncbi:hypothetical protein [Streptomyces venezuelae]|uniref:hypothetical protein n=1 Tax=Streptomyces venezuelae TaxID=54571 RepID=UPI0037AFC77E
MDSESLLQHLRDELDAFRAYLDGDLAATLSTTVEDPVPLLRGRMQGSDDAFR